MKASPHRAEPGQDRVRVAVTALTYRRPDDLAALLPQLVAHATESRHDVEVLIVDNDPEASARVLVAGYSAAPVHVQYVHATRPGIAAARNAALDAATEFDLLVFIDDDERPVSGWLDLLLETWARERSAAVVGPVVSEFEHEPEPFITAGRFFDRRRLPTGTEVDLAATNNLLLDLRRIRRLGLRFDDRLGLTGGSDTLFTRQLHAAGERMVWCDEAVVIDVVPASRLTREWVLARAYRAGNTWIRTSLMLAPTPAARLRVRATMAARGLVRAAGGAGRIALGTVSGRLDQQARGRRTLARGAGLVAGSVGRVYAEYARD